MNGRSDNSDLMSTFERMTDAVAQGIVDKAHTLDEAFGERPYGKVKLSERAQVRRYALVKDDPSYWQALVQEKGEKPVVEYAQRMERMRVRYPEEELPEVGLDG